LKDYTSTEKIGGLSKNSPRWKLPLDIIPKLAISPMTRRGDTSTGTFAIPPDFAQLGRIDGGGEALDGLGSMKVTIKSSTIRVSVIYVILE
jgi:hypothetical protein